MCWCGPEFFCGLDREEMIALAAYGHGLISNQFGSDLFSMPAFDMLLDLYLNRDEPPRSLTSLCGATRSPERTALRIIHRMVKRGLLQLSQDMDDARRVNVQLSRNAVGLLDGFFDQLVEFVSGTNSTALALSDRSKGKRE